MLLTLPATSPGFLLQAFWSEKVGERRYIVSKRWKLYSQERFVDRVGLGWREKCVVGRVSAWRGPIVWNPPAGPVASSQPGHPGAGLWSREPCTVWSLSNPLYWIGLQRIGAMFPLSPTALLSACTVNVHLGAQLALGKICKNFVCAQFVPSGMGWGEWSVHSGDVWGLVLAEEGLPSLCCRVCQECAALDSVVANRKSIHGILMRGSSSFLQE